MQTPFFYSIISVVIISLISLIGVLTLSVNKNLLSRIIIFLVSSSAGALLGDVFLHLLPEALEKAKGFTLSVSLFVLFGILVFFILEKIILWRHCHILTGKNHPHPVAFMNLIGDSFHNFLDGLIVGAAYLSDIRLGIATTVAVILHEIPQEIGDFGVLVYAGFSRRKALFLNFLTALTALIGVAAVFIINPFLKNISSILVPITAGGFLYIAGSDLIPELHKNTCNIKSYFQTGMQLIGILLGIGVMIWLTMLE